MSKENKNRCEARIFFDCTLDFESPCKYRKQITEKICMYYDSGRCYNAEARKEALKDFYK